MKTNQKTCEHCGVEFSCAGAADSLLAKKTCWCQSYPAVLPLQSGQDCRCPQCIEQWLAQGLPAYLRSLDHDAALRLASAYPINTPLQQNIDYTVENGNTVFSAWFHLKRGYCCGNGCRHCPYPQTEP